MSAEQSNPTGPDLAQGIPLDDLSDGGMLGGHVGQEPVLLARRGNEFFAIGSTCSHYGGPRAPGFGVGDTRRRPCHPARSCLRTGAWIEPPEFYKERTIDVLLGADVTGIDAKARQVMIAGGRNVAFDKLLLATGAEPVRLDVPGANQPHMHVLRSLSDSRTIIAKAKEARRVVV